MNGVSTAHDHILVIAAQGLVRFVPALGALAAVRAHHAGAVITLLTVPDTTAFATLSSFVDAVWDDAAAFMELRAFWRLRRRLRAENFARVYDLDGARLGQRVFQLLYGWRVGPRRRAAIPWSGPMAGTRFDHADPRAGAMHELDRLAAQLKIAGIDSLPPPDVAWVARRVQAFNVPFRMTAPFVLLAADPGQDGAQWPAERYAALAILVAREGLVPVVVGFACPPAVRQAIAEDCPTAVDLTGRAAASELVFLAWAAKAAAGPDNAAMQLAATAGCRSVVLCDGASDPARTGSRARNVAILRRPGLADILTGEVVAAMRLG